METVAAKASFGDFGNFAFTGAGDAGSRPFRLLLSPLDVPLPKCPTGLDPAFKWGVSSAAVAAGGNLIVGKPVHMDPTLTSHDAWFVTANGPQRKLAPSFGYHTASDIVTEDDQKFWAVNGEWWPHQDPELTAKVEAEMDTLGGSWEMRVWVDPQPDENGVKWIRKIEPTGSAILKQSAAAGGDLTKLIYASAYAAAIPELELLSAEAREAFLSNYQIQDGATAMASLPLADPDFNWNREAALERLLSWAAEDSGEINPDRARLVFLLQHGDGIAASDWQMPVADIFDDSPKLVREALGACKSSLRWAPDGAGLGYLTNTQKDQILATCRRLMARWDETDDDAKLAAASGALGGANIMAETPDLATQLAAASERNGTLAAQIESLTAERDAYANALKEADAESIAALACERDQLKSDKDELSGKVTAFETALAEAGAESVEALATALTEANEKAATADAERIEAQASAWLTEHAEQYPVESHETVKAAYAATLKGEALSAEQFTAMASGKAPEKAPEGDDDELQPAGDVSASADTDPTSDLRASFQERLHKPLAEGGFAGDRVAMNESYTRARVAQMRGEG